MIYGSEWIADRETMDAYARHCGSAKRLAKSELKFELYPAES